MSPGPLFCPSRGKLDHMLPEDSDVWAQADGGVAPRQRRSPPSFLVYLVTSAPANRVNPSPERAKAGCRMTRAKPLGWDLATPES